jgi:hypothetical protein
MIIKIINDKYGFSFFGSFCVKNSTCTISFNPYKKLSMVHVPLNLINEKLREGGVNGLF